jgi:hypothetical protein
MPDMVRFFREAAWIFAGSTIGIVLAIWLFALGKKNYTVQDAETQAEEFGNVIKESYGGMTIFLWVWFVFSLGWAIYYYIINWPQFYVITALGLQGR